VNRFYGAATEALIRCDAIIDKLIGDEVMALFIPGICGPEYHRRAIEAAFGIAAGGRLRPIRASLAGNWRSGPLGDYLRWKRG
jgi:hypothetical protein